MNQLRAPTTATVLSPSLQSGALAFSSRLRGSTSLQRLFCAFAAIFACATPVLAGQTFHTRYSFRHAMPRTVRADHPAIIPVVAAIQAVSSDPREQIVIVNDVTHLLVEYDDDERVYGRTDYHATLDEMIERRRQKGWLYLRDDCDGRAVFAAHLLAGLGIPWRLETSYWKRHAWVVARVDGVDYDLLDLRPEEIRHDAAYRLIGRRVTRATRSPTFFQWRRAWADRTAQDFDIGFQLGLLSFDSTPGNPRQRNSTDWAEEVPGGRESPFDMRTLKAAYAGFPLGETLRVGAIASAPASAAPVSARPAMAGPSSTEPAASETASSSMPEPTAKSTLSGGAGS